MKTCRIINFHGIGTPGRQLDPGEATYWVGRTQFEAILDRIVYHNLRSPIRITFDDSNSSDVEIAALELMRRKLTATFFVLTGRIGQPGSLDATNVRQLQSMGMRIGSHGIDHRDLRTLDSNALALELAGSKSALKQLSVVASTFAIPFGRYNSKVLREIRKAGYESAHTSDGGAALQGAFIQARSSVRGDMGDGEIETILAGHLPLYRQLRRNVVTTIKRFV